MSAGAGLRGRAWLEIDRDALRHNIRTLQGLLPPGCALSAVVKANAYGHGLVPVSMAAQEEGVRHFCVACADEGIALRRAGVRGKILILGYTGPERAEELIRFRLTQTLVDRQHAAAMNAAVLDAAVIPAAAVNSGAMRVFDSRMEVHLKVDTGMHRLGFPADAPEQAADVTGMKGLAVTGLFSHLAVPEGVSQEAARFTAMQADRFRRFLDGFHPGGAPSEVTVHLQSSYGFLNQPELTERFHCGIVRSGVALYGVKSSPEDRLRLTPDLRPVLAFRSRVVSVRTVDAGEYVGYGMAYRAERSVRIAAVSAGYADGIPRSLSCGAGTALVKGKRARICGRVCMDLCMIDVTNLPDVVPGDVVTWIGQDGTETITAAEMAAAAGTISNELLSRLGTRPPRILLSSFRKTTGETGNVISMPHSTTPRYPAALHR